MATGTVKWFNNKKVMASSLRMRADRTFSFTFLLYKKPACALWKKALKSVMSCCLKEAKLLLVT